MKKALTLFLAMVMLLSIGITSYAESEKPVSLRLIMYGDSNSRRDEYFEHTFHDRIMDELNIDLTVEWLPWSEMNGTVLTNMLASGESIAFENIVALNDFHAKGYEANISMDMINELMPGYLAMRGPSNGFECASYQGNVVCIPMGAKAYGGRHQLIGIRVDLVDEVGMDVNEIDTIAEVEECIGKVKELYPDMSVFRGDPICEFAYELAGINTAEFQNSYCIVNENDDSDEIISFYESDLFKEYCKLMEKWVELGYQTSSAITDPNKTESDWLAGNCLMMYGTPDFWIDRGLSRSIEGIDTTIIQIGDFPLIKTRDYDWGISFSKAAEADLESWLKLINWIYADIENYNFCCYGVEGVDYEIAADGTIDTAKADGLSVCWDEWFLQASCYKVYDADIPAERLEAFKKNDDNSKVSKLSGFTFDPTPVETEAALLDAVRTEYLDPMFKGFGDIDSNYEDVLQKLKDAGIDEYVAEYQRQFSEFIKNK